MKALIYIRENNPDCSSAVNLLTSKGYLVTIKTLGEVWNNNSNNSVLSLTTPNYNEVPVTIINDTYITGLRNLQKYLELNP